MQISGEEEKEEAVTSCIPKGVSNFPISDGEKFVYQILNGPNEHCLENFRMDKAVFYKLCDILQTRGLLRHTNRIKVEEQLAIFLFIVGHNLRTRAVQELFRYSGETISRHFNNALNAVMAISMDFFRSPNVDETLEDPRFYPYFKDCVGVVDCIHIPVMVGVDEQGPFRNYNGLLTQKVLLASSFDLRFHYVLAGWEGSASDQQVLNAALTRLNKLQVPRGKYYIVDNKYQNLPGFIAPYHGVSVNSREEPKEVFNERHRLLHRRTIDQTFGALKERFPILLSAPPYPLQTQVKLVIAACALHNYVRLENPNDFVFKMFEQETMAEDTGEENQGEIEGGHEHDGFRVEDLEDCLRLRDEIASDIWNHYVQNLPTF